jgi:calcineurin-like phosphoesterase family protein
MSSDMTTYYTSDLHFGHLNIIRFCDRPFPGVPAMNARLVQLWNETVTDDDTVWVLGDVALGALDESLAHIGRLAGHKILVPGNHDRCWEGDRALRKGDPEARERRRATARERYLDAGFAEIHDRPEQVVLGDQKVDLSHFPYEGDSHGADRFVEYRPVDRGGWVVHGHVHDTWRQRGRQINVGVDVWGGRPVPAETIAGLIADGPRELEPMSWS